jgi:hypothetical protein
MDRESFLALVARAVAEGLLTEDEAQNLILDFGAGLLYALSLPVPVQPEGFTLTVDEIGAGWRWARSAGNRRESLVSQFGQQVTTAATYANENPATWQRQMESLLKTHLIAQNIAGGRAGMVMFGDRERLDAIALEQIGYLSRFADHIAVKALLHEPLSERYIAARAKQYAGAGYGEWFRSREEADDLGDGWVYDFRARDDGGTCSSCVAADIAGPYLQGVGPYPGVVCDGHGHCRCIRVARYAPQEYKRLTG